MAKEQRTADQLAALIRERLAMPGLRVIVYPDPMGWSANAFADSADATLPLRVSQVTDELRGLYDLIR